MFCRSDLILNFQLLSNEASSCESVDDWSEFWMELRVAGLVKKLSTGFPTQDEATRRKPLEDKPDLPKRCEVKNRQS